MMAFKASSSSLARSGMSRARSLSLSHVSQLAEKTLKEKAKDFAVAAGKKGADLAGQAFVFGAVDAVGDTIRDKAGEEQHLADKVDKIQENTLKIQEASKDLETRKMEHAEKMKQLELKRMVLMQGYKPTVTIEEVNDEEMDRANSKKQQLQVTFQVSIQ